MAIQSFKEGLNRPASIKPIVCRVTPALSASCACVRSFSTLANLTLFFLCEVVFDPC
jgi:hypothetical protein